MARWSGTLGRLAYRHPGIVLSAALAWLGASLVLILRLRFENDLNTLIPTAAGEVLERVDRAFGLKEQAFLLVEAGEENAGALLSFARAFAAEISRSDLIAETEFGYDQARDLILEKLAAYGPRFAGAADRPALRQLFSRAGLDGQLQRQLARLSMPGASEMASLIEKDPLDLGSFLTGRMQAVRGAYRFNALSPYYLSPDNRALLIRLRGKKPLNDTAGARATALAVENAVEQAKAQIGAPLSIRAGGSYFLAREMESMIRRDMTLSLSTSTALVFLLIAWTLRSARLTFLFIPPLLAGFVLALGIYSAFHSAIAAISLGSATMLVGLGVDFAIHYLLMAQAERARGSDLETAVYRAASGTGPGLASAALTTMAAFLAFLFSSFEFLRQMGLMTALGIAGILLATLTLLPALLNRWFRRCSGVAKPPRSLGVASLVLNVIKAPRLVLTAVLLAGAAAVVLLLVSPPGLETDLRNLHARSSEALLAERRIGEIFGGSQDPLLLLLESGSEPELEEHLHRLHPHLERLVKQGNLAAFASAAIFLPEAGGEQEVLRQLSTLDAPVLESDLTAAFEAAGFEKEAISPAKERILAAARDLQPLTFDRLRRLGLWEFIDRLVGRDPRHPERSLSLISLFPKLDLWSPERRDSLTRAVTGALAAEKLQGTLSGLAIVSAESAGLVAVEITRIGGVALLAVVIVVAAQFRNLKSIALVFLPVTLGCLWTAAALQLFGYSVNFMNAAVFPMILGMGIDYGIHAVHRFLALRSEKAGAKTSELIEETFSVTGTGLALSSLTTMIAFGSLAFSQNRGIASVGALCVIGIGACLAASITALPAALAIFDRRTGIPGEENSRRRVTLL